MSKKVGVLLIIHNFLNLTKACLESLTKATEYPYKLLAIENNSTDETLESILE